MCVRTTGTDGGGPVLRGAVLRDHSSFAGRPPIRRATSGQFHLTGLPGLILPMRAARNSTVGRTRTVETAARTDKSSDRRFILPARSELSNHYFEA